MSDIEALIAGWHQLRGLFENSLQHLQLDDEGWLPTDYHRQARRALGLWIRAGHDFHHLLSNTCFIPAPQDRWAILQSRPVGTWRYAVDGQPFEREFWEVYWILVVRWVHEMPHSTVVLAHCHLLQLRTPEAWDEDYYPTGHAGGLGIEDQLGAPLPENHELFMEATEASVAVCNFILDKLHSALEDMIIDSEETPTEWAQMYGIHLDYPANTADVPTAAATSAGAQSEPRCEAGRLPSLTKDQQKALDYIRDHGPIPGKELAEKVHTSYATIRRWAQQGGPLHAHGVVNPRNGDGYIVKKPM